jgi:hypothetical protein
VCYAPIILGIYPLYSKLASPYLVGKRKEAGLIYSRLASKIQLNTTYSQPLLPLTIIRQHLVDLVPKGIRMIAMMQVA